MTAVIDSTLHDESPVQSSERADAVARARLGLYLLIPDQQEFPSLEGGDLESFA